MKKIYLFLLLSLSLLPATTQAQYPDAPVADYGGYTYSEARIQVALLLDVSGSMEGLIEQAKSQLWYIVNGLMASHDGQYPPRLELALYEYGSDQSSLRSRYLRQITPFTTDLDWFSSELFRLRVGGRYEYCGAVLESALYDLNWSNRPDDRRMIYLAGNESFGMGPVPSRPILEAAYRRGITVNTIFCGNPYQGTNLGWREAAYQGGGEYLSIDQNYRDRYDRDPYGGRLLGLNQQFNQTYVPYGHQAHMYQQRQQHEDQHARQYGDCIASQRAITKASPAYLQPQWDLVDAVATGQVDLATLPSDQLPADMRSMSLPQQQQYLQQKAQQRQALRQEIQAIAAAPQPNPMLPASPSTMTRPSPRASSPMAPSNTLGGAILQSTQSQASPTRPQPTASPTVRQSSPSRPSSTPTVRQAAPSRPSSTPTVRQSSPSRPSSTPTVRQAAPSRPSSTPTVRQAAPSRPSSTPTVRQSAPSRPSSTPTVRQAAPSRPSSTPTVRQAAPSRPSSTPTVRQAAPSRPSSTPTVRQAAPSRPSSTPTVRQAAPSRSSSTPTRQGGNVPTRKKQ